MAQAVSTSRTSWAALAGWTLFIAIVAIAGAAIVFQARWWPQLQARLGSSTGELESEAHDDHDHHDHGHAGHDEANSVELSPQARKNIGLQTDKVQLTSFTRTVSIPGIVVERPGRSTLKVTTPMTGIITRIYPVEGESAEPGEPLFELRLTHEEIVQAQADLLRTAEELDVVAREIARLEKITADGAIAGKALLERQYEQQKLQAVNRSQQQALLLHGLTKQQVAAILEDRSLLQKVTIYAPPSEAMGNETGTKFQIQAVGVAPGQHVAAGDSLAVLIDYSSLLIEGNAFEADASLIDQAARRKETVTATLDREGGGDRIDGLKILYQASRIDPETRTIHFYVVLPNEVQEEPAEGGERSFLSWKFRPGQRMRLLVPAESWSQRIVLPVDAVAQDGVETYVFAANGDHFDRRPVHVEHRDDVSVVIANDGALFPGDIVATNAAQQLQLAIKNKSGGAIDPHAGHSH